MKKIEQNEPRKLQPTEIIAFALIVNFLMGLAYHLGWILCMNVKYQKINFIGSLEIYDIILTGLYISPLLLILNS